MAGAKKKKSKPAANPARGFATTSVASKARVDTSTPDQTPPPDGAINADPQAAGNSAAPILPMTAQPHGSAPYSQPEPTLSPEEFEKQLEESELQLLVDKHAQKVKRDALRQKTRLDTERRLLRGQAEPLNTRKWLPQELIDQILDLIQAESRFATSSLTSDRPFGEKTPSEEDLTMRLWTLQQTLTSLSISNDKIDAILQHVLELAPNVASSSRDYIWGLEEALDWLAKQCNREELRDYDYKSTKPPISQPDTPYDSPLASGENTPRLTEANGAGKHTSLKNGLAHLQSSRSSSSKKIVITCDEDFEPDDLIPHYRDAMEKLFWLQRPKLSTKKPNGVKNRPVPASKMLPLDSTSDDLEEAKLLAKIDRIEQDILFDKPLAEHMWRNRRVELEKEFAANARKVEQERGLKDHSQESGSEDEITKEAERMAAEILQQDDDDEDQSLSDLFGSLPIQETDAAGRTNTVINGSDGVKITIRDFGTWSGVSPTRALEEACRSR
ncbi:hypothetical protein F5Y19DRAFT_403170 [Xylariaceae sp. FL1651]|nr:hypothetical protein F5Y19DRAFT_403170 [Xylariaceae sp. FL1651]